MLSMTTSQVFERYSSSINGISSAEVGVIQSLIFLKLVVAGHLTMFVTRNTGHFWSAKPSGIFFWSVILTDIFATYWLFMDGF
jgi:hypothetical protein